MSLLSRIFGVFGRARAGRAPLRPLWLRIVEIAREPQWYNKCGVADTVSGRFDAITLALSLVLLRMEKEPALIEPSVRLTEIFVEDMDGQLRQSGVGDLVVGKHIGKLMQVLGGRLGAYRDGLEQGEAALVAALERNVTLAEDAEPSALAAAVLDLNQQIAGVSSDDLLQGRLAR
ncbi:MAG: ubiquinol-cytochrome C chaperone family protein [Novosphingobium sp.]|nr:ubiquinol-cytochrome C chaperone family protein [Novosphingobium sp.]